MIAFNVRANKEAREAAERAGIEIRYYNIIYDLVDDVKKAMSGLPTPTLRETMLGNAQILEIFKVSKVGNIAGCKVTDGTVERGANVRLIRDNVVIHEGKLRNSSGSRMTCAKSAPAWSAAWPSRLPGHAARRRDGTLSGGGKFNARCVVQVSGRDGLFRSANLHCHARAFPGRLSKDGMTRGAVLDEMAKRGHDNRKFVIMARDKDLIEKTPRWLAAAAARR